LKDEIKSNDFKRHQSGFEDKEVDACTETKSRVYEAVCKANLETRSAAKSTTTKTNARMVKILESMRPFRLGASNCELVLLELIKR
jgi:hypothetical protein